MMQQKKSQITILVLTNTISLVFLAIIAFHYDVPRKVILKISGNYHEFYEHYEVRNGLFSVYDKKSYRIVMLGDSITEGVAWNELLGISDIANRGIGGDTTEGILNRLSSIYEINPEICFIMAGINDIGKGIKVETIIKNMEEIIYELGIHGIKVIIQSTLYVAENAKNWEESNAAVKELNTWLKKYCDEKGLLFIDINKTLGSDNKLNAEYTYDGVHLLGTGYKRWREMIMPVI